MADKLTPAYNLVSGVSYPIVRFWGRMRVTGIDLLPESGPVILCANHDSYWDTVTVAAALRSRRQVHALAKSQLWKNPIMARVLDGMGQIPIERGKGDVAALDRAIEGLRAGICIGIFPEGTRSLGRQLRGRSGIGRLAAAVPEAQVVGCALNGPVDVPKFPRRPRITVELFRPAGGGLQPGESHADFAGRLVAELRAKAPYVTPKGHDAEAPPT
jgi:1-acyl-sn-glycerol-3-phosphate acyltransferase